MSGGESRLYALPGSPPCVAVERALQLKQVPHRRVELMPLGHFVHQRVRFGSRTVPGIRFPDGEKVIGSREIMRRLDERAPEPSLRTADPEVAEAERFGDEVLQGAGRRIASQAAVRAEKKDIVEFIGGDQMPVPRRLLEPQVKIGARMYGRIMGSSAAAARADLAELPRHLDHVDALIERGVIGGERPNAADLQIGSMVRLLAAVGDLRPLLEGRPALELGQRHFGDWHAELPAGLIPRDWLP